MNDNELLIAVEVESLASALRTGDGIEAMIDLAKKTVRSFEHDLSTVTGRKKTAGLAYKVARVKSKVTEIQKGETEALKKASGIIDGNGRRLRNELDALKIEARQPPKAHVERIEAEALTACIEILGHESGVSALKAIKAGNIPHVSITY
jgi:hypothetical protein